MKILNLNFINFRNLKDHKINLSEGINVFYGKNAQGKTSILEAIYFAALGISFRTRKAAEILKYETKKFGTFMEYEDEIGKSSLSVKYIHSALGQKSFFINSKRRTQSDFFGNVNIIVYIPEDIIILNGGPKNRRSFFDLEISQYDKSYLENLKNFNKLLKIRNKFLKEKNTNNVEYKIYNQNYISYAAKIIKSRLDYVAKIGKILSELYKELFKIEDELKLFYRSLSKINKNSSLKEIEELIKENLQNVQANEERYGYTLIGPQKDDYLFSLNGKDASFSASQGEKKSIIFSLKLAELELIKANKSEYPIVLIDDITSYFDINRRKAVLDFLMKNKVQVIISSTDLLNIEANNFYVEKGEIFNEIQEV